MCSVDMESTACFSTGFVQSMHNTARSVLVDAINDKCANCRRKKHV